MKQNKIQSRRYLTSQTTTEVINGKEMYRLIPVPSVPVFPVMSWASMFPFFHTKIPSLFQNNQIQYFTAARYALYQALKIIGVKSGDEILLPAYHCKAMVHPILDVGGKPVFYKINKDFSADTKDIKKLINSNSKAVIAVNYFGFIQNIAEVRAICDQKKLKLVEDCAHSLFGSHMNNIVGSTGDYAIGSTKKFFSVQQGGILTSKNTIRPFPSPLSLRTELQFIYNNIEKAIDYGRLRIFKPLFFLINKMRSNNNIANFSERTEVSPAYDPGQEYYDPTQNHEQPPKLSIMLEKTVSHHRIHMKRRENYVFLVAALGNIPGIKVTIPTLPSGIVPYMLPVFIENLTKIFPDIENQGIPFQRFGQFLWNGAERCHNSINYSEKLIQLPCHQELTLSELQWIADQIRSVMRLNQNRAKK